MKPASPSSDPIVAEPGRSRLWLLGLCFASGFMLVTIAILMQRLGLFSGITKAIWEMGDRYSSWFATRGAGNPLLLMLLAFCGGLISSLSPCILSLLPVNLTYIGTREVTSRQDAALKAGAFVLGVATTLSLLSLFTALGGVVLLQFRGYFTIAVGLLIALMGLSLCGLLRLPLPRLTPKVSGLGPYGVGLTFALISSPCSSPVLVAVLAVGTETGSLAWSMLIMASFTLGYTAIIFLASLFAGLAKSTRFLLRHAEPITWISSIALMLLGGFYVVDGLVWIFSTLKS